MSYFSVIIPAYNRARFLGECLDSVLAQTFTDWECIVVDDGSTDGTRELVEGYVRRDGRFRYHWQENAGASAARNAGIALATGEWIAFLDSDDWYYPNALAHFREAVIEFPAVQIVCGYLDCHRPLASKDKAAVSVADAFHAMTGFRGWAPPLCMSSAAVRPRVIAEVGGFSSAYGTAEDTEFWIRATARFEVATVHAVVAHYRRGHGDSKHDRFVANGKKIEVKRRILQDLIGNPVVQARLREDPLEASWWRWHHACLATLEAARLLREGDVTAATERLRDAARYCDSPENVVRAVWLLGWMLSFPADRPSQAMERWYAALHALMQRLSLDGDRQLRQAFGVPISDAYFRTAILLRIAGNHAEAWRVALSGLCRVPSWRSAKSMMHFLRARPVQR
jgi:hypothetical protein